MLSYIEKTVASHKTPWHCRTQILTPSSKKHPASVILIHGFMGSPFDMKPVAHTLAKEGFRVLVPLIEGQTADAPLHRRRQYTAGYFIRKFKNMIEQETQESGCRPHIAGISMGGTIATVMAAQNIVQKLVLLAPFYQLPSGNTIIRRITRIMTPVLPYVPKFSKGRINHRPGYEEYRPGSGVLCLRSFHHLCDLADMARECAPQIQIPTRLFLSRGDQVACAETTLQLLKEKPNVKIHKMPGANHILTYEACADEMIENINAFFQEG